MAIRPIFAPCNLDVAKDRSPMTAYRHRKPLWAPRCLDSVPIVILVFRELRGIIYHEDVSARELVEET